MRKQIENLLIGLGLAIVMLLVYKLVINRTELTQDSLEISHDAPDIVREGWIELNNIPLDIRYATKNNFTHQKIYPCGRCFLRTEVGEALLKVQEKLKAQDLSLVLFDCYRPQPAQQKLWNIVPNPDYVAPPDQGSMHNKGLAIDLSIADATGTLVDMGTEYDHFGIKAHADHYDLPNRVLKNRKILDDTMREFGFKGIRTEWWHFSYPLPNATLESWEWVCN